MVLTLWYRGIWAASIHVAVSIPLYKDHFHKTLSRWWHEFAKNFDWLKECFIVWKMGNRGELVESPSNERWNGHWSLRYPWCTVDTLYRVTVSGLLRVTCCFDSPFLVTFLSSYRVRWAFGYFYPYNREGSKGTSGNRWKQLQHSVNWDTCDNSGSTVLTDPAWYDKRNSHDPIIARPSLSFI